MAPQKPLNPDFETIYDAYYDRVYRYAYTILLNREDAEDVVEETFLAAYAAYGRYDPSLAASVYLENDLEQLMRGAGL